MTIVSQTNISIHLANIYKERKEVVAVNHGDFENHHDLNDVNKKRIEISSVQSLF